MAAKQAAMTVGVVLVVGAILAFIFRGPNDLMAISISGLVAVAIQIGAFTLSRAAGATSDGAHGHRRHSAALHDGGVRAARDFRTMIPAVAALVSLAAFFFLSTLIEPLLTKS